MFFLTLTLAWLIGTHYHTTSDPISLSSAEDHTKERHSIATVLTKKGQKSEKMNSPPFRSLNRF
jgi:hypothetical protein